MGRLLTGTLCISALAALAAAVPAEAGAAAPTVTAVAPAEGPTEGGTEVRITGTGFQECSVIASAGGGLSELVPRGCEQVIVRFGTAPGLVVAATATEIDAFSQQHAPGTVDVTVTTPNGQSATSAADHFTFVGAPPTPVSGPLPVVHSVVPHKGPPAGFTEITIHGKNLLPPGVTHCVSCAGVSVDFGTLSVPVLEGTQEEIGVVSPPHPPGTVPVIVTTPTGSSEGSGYGSMGKAATFTYVGMEHEHEHGHHHHHHHGHDHGHGGDHGRGHHHGNHYGAGHFDSSGPSH